jgi:hypothetical protein
MYKDDIEKAGGISRIYNACIYDWYYGNIVHKLLLYVFQPYLFLLNFDRTTQYSKILSKVQIQDILRTAFDIIANKKCDLTIRDYYNNSLSGIIMSFSIEDNMPNLLKNYLPHFRYLLRNATNIVEIQQSYVKQYLELKRKKAAVAIFEKYFLEVLLSPYTKIGKRYIDNLKIKFDMEKMQISSS